MSGSAAQPLVNQARQNDEDNDTLWTAFTQQRLKAWQTILPPNLIIALYVLGGIVFVGLGILLLLMSWGVEEYTLPYTDKVPVDGVSEVNIEITHNMEPPIWVYYQLDSFHQNHRRYVKSRDDRQLQAMKPVKVTEDKLAACKPAVMGERGRPLYPCGLVARSVFNDTFALLTSTEGDKWERLDVDDSARTIAWAADVDSGKFKNYDPEEVHPDHSGKTNQDLLDMWLIERFPPVTCEQKEITDTKRFKPAYVKVENGQAACKGYTSDSPSCEFVDREGKDIQCDGSGEYQKSINKDWGLESGHFLVWMRVAGLPSFRKLWGKVNKPLARGTRLKLYVADNFPVKKFNGKKAVVISTSSPLGGRNDFLGSGYLAVGVCCLIFGTWFLYKRQCG